MRKTRHIFFALVLGITLGTFASHAYAACSSPAGNEGALEFDSTQKQFKYCDGTNWNFIGGGGGGGGVYIVASRWHQTNSFPTCVTGSNVGCMRGNGNTVAAADGILESCAGLSLTACNIYGNGFHYDADLLTNYSGLADRLNLRILEDTVARFSSGTVNTQNSSGVNQNWGVCWCGSN